MMNKPTKGLYGSALDSITDGSGFGSDPQMQFMRLSPDNAGSLVSPLLTDETASAGGAGAGATISVELASSPDAPALGDAALAIDPGEKGAVGFGLPDITDPKLLMQMAREAVGWTPDPTPNAAAFQGDPSTIQDEAIVPIAVGGTATGVIDFNGDTDDLTVSLVAGQRYMISLMGSGASAVKDTFLEIFNPSNVSIGHDDDGGVGTNSLMTITAAVTGTYTIRASAFANPGDPGTGQYTVDVRQMG